jgi:hypothetical protein
MHNRLEKFAYMQSSEFQLEENACDEAAELEAPKVPRAYWRPPQRKLSTLSLPELSSLDFLEFSENYDEQLEEDDDEKAVSRRVRNKVLAASRHWVMEDELPGSSPLSYVYPEYRREVDEMLAEYKTLTRCQKAWLDHVDELQYLDGITRKTSKQLVRLAELDAQTLEIRAAWKADEAAEEEFLAWIASAEAKEAARANYMREMEVEYARKKLE